MLRKTVFYSFAIALAASVIGSYPALAAGDRDDRDESVGNVYTMNNDVTSNQVLAFVRARDGALRYIGKTATGGQGAATQAAFDPLGSQDSVILSDNHRALFVVNAGSNQLSVFRLTRR